MTVHVVPDYYPTLAHAATAAANGDTIVLRPSAGQQTISGWPWNKRVHIKGDTTSPMTNVAAILVSSSPQIPWTGGSGGDVWFEGVTWRSTPSGRPYLQPLAGGGIWRFNRCWMDVVDDSQILDANGAKMRFTNCRYEANRGHEFFTAWGGASVEAIKCRMDSAWSSVHGAPVVIVDDSVYTDTAGYGPAYGDWYFEQFAGQVYALGGKVRLRLGDAPNEATVRLFRAGADGMPERIQWAVTTPGPPDADGFGAWRFDYLPTSYDYYIGIVGPRNDDGSPRYAPALHGPYRPAPLT